MPTNISYTLLVHAGSYKDFLAKVNAKFPKLQIKYVKRVAIHYYILQVEDTSEKGIDKKDIYALPIMAMREEFSSFIFFKNTKSYNNVLKRMCNADKDENAAFNLTQHMMTPFEKSRMLNLKDAKTLKIDTSTDKEKSYSTYYSSDKINSAEILNKLFALDRATVDNVEREFATLAKEANWIIGIH